MPCTFKVIHLNITSQLIQKILKLSNCLGPRSICWAHSAIQLKQILIKKNKKNIKQNSAEIAVPACVLYEKIFVYYKTKLGRNKPFVVLLKSNRGKFVQGLIQQNA